MRLNVLKNRRIQVALAVASTAALIAACSSSSSSDGGNPTGPSPDTGVPTVTVTAAGVSPKEVRIPVGGRVRFVNNDTVNRQVNSNPFPTHDGCPPINEVDVMTPGQAKMTGELSFEGACGFHEHLTEDNPDFRGVIVIGNASADDAAPDGY